MNLKKVMIALACAYLAGCASVPMGDPAKDQELKKFSAKPETSGIYIYRNEMFGGAIKMDVEVDGKPIGQTGAKTYLYSEIQPGQHIITSKAENTDSIQITTLPGKLYYIWQEVKMGILYARNKLHAMSEDEGKKGVLETNLAVTR